MGLFDFLKTKGDDIDTTEIDAAEHATEDKLLLAKLYRQLRNKGLEEAIDQPSLAVLNDRVTISGKVKTEAIRDQVVQTLGNFQGVASVDDRLSVVEVKKDAAAPTSPVKTPVGSAKVTTAPKPAAAAPAQPAKKVGPAPVYHTVGEGSTLWAIAEKYLGDGNRYMEIFEANRPMLKDPDVLTPGQKLVIPAKK